PSGTRSIASPVMRKRPPRRISATGNRGGRDRDGPISPPSEGAVSPRTSGSWVVPEPPEGFGGVKTRRSGGTSGESPPSGTVRSKKMYNITPAPARRDHAA